MTVEADSSPASLSTGKSKAWPPGFRFHPTDEELVLFYLKRKVCKKKLVPDVIAETDVYKWDPEELPGQSALQTGDRQWFFFSPRDRRYPNGARSNRATRHGYWKATGKDRCISCNYRNVGVKKTLVYYKGRAPSGERTDWVMHEYTLDEEELKRCLNFKDYYALYKVYKKSGPGPKNGEQYGAPFNEEQWADDDYSNCDSIPAFVELSRKKTGEVTPVDTAVVYCEGQLPFNGGDIDDIDDIIKCIVNDPVFDVPHIAEYPYSLSQAAEVEIPCSEVEASAIFQFDDPARQLTHDFNLSTSTALPLHESSEVTTALATHQDDDAVSKQYVQPSYDFAESTSPQLPSHESSEVTSAFSTQQRDPPVLGEGDFLEIDDLWSPDVTPSNADKSAENLKFDDFDGLGEFDLYHDAAAIFGDVLSNDQEPYSPPYVSTFDVNNDVLNHEFQMHPNLEVPNQIGHGLSMHYSGNTFTSANLMDDSLSQQTSGLLNESGNFSTQANHSIDGSGRSRSRFSSALWSFVETIPTNPASASETTLVNRAFERMSSFSRVVKQTSAAGNDIASTRLAPRKRSSFIFFSSLVAACAIFWVSVGNLRLLGKWNFCRHYYYRLVRRMNKLLGPGLCLDPKNSKDTNAAMLRWWSLLEKYSCKASKLHLKPRRFKIFIEALELQLLKDRKKNISRRLLQGENCNPTAPGAIPNQSRALGNDVRSVKLVFVDSQNIQKLGPRKASLKRNANMGVNCINKKGELDSVKHLRQRRKPGTTSAAAYKKWEKAAIAGVSLVADAAVHLEQTATTKEIKDNENNPGRKCNADVQSDLPSLPTFPKIHFMVDRNGPNPAKLKLQLFPIDDGTRRALEMDKYNPYLELTLSSKKKISSVLDHLNKKWGDSSAAAGELMLLPYNTQNGNSASYQRWTLDSILSAADVYTILGSPQVFRLRYGWFSNFGVGSASMQGNMESGYTLDESNKSNTIFNTANKIDQVTDSASLSVSSTNDMSPKHQATCIARDHAQAATPADLPSMIDDHKYSNPRIDIAKFSDLEPNVSCKGDDRSYFRMTLQKEDMDDAREKGLSACEWADSLTNISVGDLLSGVAHDIVDDCMDAPVAESSCCMHQVPFCSDSFDAAIAAHISRQQDKTVPRQTLASNISSIWDGEETCDAFSFKKDTVLLEDCTSFSAVTSLESSKQLPRNCSECSGNNVEQNLPEVGGEAKDEFLSDPSVLDNTATDANGLTDMYWPDSLGPLDLDIQCSKYHSEDMILSDSLSGLNRLIASSLDAFQNFSFFGYDKKEVSPTVEARGIASVSDVKVSSEV